MNQELLKEYVEYKDGELIHKKFRKNVNIPIGGILGYSHRGYKIVRFFRKKYGVHQLVYLYHFGFIPSAIDHINGNGWDNRIENLRPADKSQNAANQKIKRNSKTGIKGVRLLRGKFYSAIGFDGKRIKKGPFNSKEEAQESYLKMAQSLFGEYANINVH